ncbi:MAG: hypothetical protein QF805_13565, partial [Pirellulaceae bacterium]|nr:hypothetical protein [Pirellulaceae bacterium]
RDGKAVATRGVRGRLSLREKGSRQQRHYDLYPTVDRASGDPCLRADVNFTKIRNGDATASVVIHRLNPSGQPPLRVSEAFRRTPPPDVIAIQRQLVCPVSGKILVAEPKTVKVRAGDVVVYVCCQGCASTVRLAPEKYIKRLAKLPPPGKGSPK